MSKLQTELKWRPYLRTIALGSGLPARQAKRCLGVKGNTVSGTRNSFECDLVAKRLDDSGYRDAIEAVDRMAAMYERGAYTHEVSTSHFDGWLDIGNGGHMKRNIRPSDGNGSGVK